MEGSNVGPEANWRPGGRPDRSNDGWRQESGDRRPRNDSRQGEHASWRGGSDSWQRGHGGWHGGRDSWRASQQPSSQSRNRTGDNAEHFGTTGAQGRGLRGQQIAGQYGNRILSSERPQTWSETRSRQDTQQRRPQQLPQTGQRESVGEITEKVQGMSLERGPRETGGKEVARGLLGTCLDMCPEKERRDRERFKDLAVFERVDGSRERTSADLAVKKFSRNAAECPEDIRPVPVLLRTMEYLLGLLDDPRGQSLATVHAFLWDRFRAIRQDLTLQHCVSPAAVRLHEQMARFHILSHYELCESSGPQVRASPPEEERFEPHMNLEQLSKTLAGLFQMYDDLHRKGGVEFRTEGEFRAYYILMQTAKSDGRVDAAAVTPLLMRLRPAVLQSCEVCFTLRAFCCARAGDYVRFFRLAAGASYLQTCILHGAFPQVRSRALQVLNKASMKGQAWPLAALSSVLSTEGEVAPSVLCLDYGLRLAEDRQGQPAVLLNEPGVIVQRPVNTVHRKARLVDGLRRLRSLRSEVECNA